MIVEIRTVLPRTSSGKIDKKRLLLNSESSGV